MRSLEKCCTPYPTEGNRSLLGLQKHSPSHFYVCLYMWHPRCWCHGNRVFDGELTTRATGLQVSDAQALMQALGAHAASEVLGLEGRPAGAQRSRAEGAGFGPAHTFLPPARLGTHICPPAVARTRCTLCLLRPQLQALSAKLHVSWLLATCHSHPKHTSRAFTSSIVSNFWICSNSVRSWSCNDMLLMDLQVSLPTTDSCDSRRRL